MRNIEDKQWKDTDGSTLWVQRGWTNGCVLVDTDPDSETVDTMVELTPAQVAELVEFLQDNG
jgi:hypothetical protein